MRKWSCRHLCSFPFSRRLARKGPVRCCHAGSCRCVGGRGPLLGGALVCCCCAVVMSCRNARYWTPSATRRCQCGSALGLQLEQCLNTCSSAPHLGMRDPTVTCIEPWPNPQNWVMLIGSAHCNTCTSTGIARISHCCAVVAVLHARLATRTAFTPSRPQKQAAHDSKSHHIVSKLSRCHDSWSVAGS